MRDQHLAESLTRAVGAVHETSHGEISQHTPGRGRKAEGAMMGAYSTHCFGLGRWCDEVDGDETLTVSLWL